MLSYVSEIRLFAGDKPPKDWLPCNGAVLRIADNEILFSRIGWDFGPFAQTAFSLPTLAAPAAGVQFVICAKGMYPFDSIADAISEVKLFAGRLFNVRDSVPCQGGLLPINQNTALFSIVGTRFGGDGRSTFGIPNLAPPIEFSLGYFMGIGGIFINGMGWGDQIVSEIRLAPALTDIRAPRDFLPCDGQSVSRTEERALFSTIGTKFGADSPSTFRLPSVPPPLPGLSYWIARRGVFPS